MTKDTILNSRAWHKVRDQARHRDQTTTNPDGTHGAPCWICRQPIDYQLPTTDNESWQPDHAHPRVTHPELALDLGNLRPSHARCNKRRSDRKEQDTGLGVQTRSW